MKKRESKGKVRERGTQLLSQHTHSPHNSLVRTKGTTPAKISVDDRRDLEISAPLEEKNLESDDADVQQSHESEAAEAAVSTPRDVAPAPPSATSNPSAALEFVEFAGVAQTRAATERLRRAKNGKALAGDISLEIWWSDGATIVDEDVALDGIKKDMRDVRSFKTTKADSKPKGKLTIKKGSSRKGAPESEDEEEVEAVQDPLVEGYKGNGKRLGERSEDTLPVETAENNGHFFDLYDSKTRGYCADCTAVVAAWREAEENLHTRHIVCVVDWVIWMHTDFHNTVPRQLHLFEQHYEFEHWDPPIILPAVNIMDKAAVKIETERYRKWVAEGSELKIIWTFYQQLKKTAI